MKGHEGLSLADALRYAPSFLRKGFLLNDAVTCIYIDGLPQPLVTANQISAADVEAVEVYGLRSDYTGTVASRWPPGASCGDPGAPRPARIVRGGSSAFANARSRRGSGHDTYVRALVVWLKR
jgi:hypothetical protein